MLEVLVDLAVFPVKVIQLLIRTKNSRIDLAT
jgi:hypothetical protein